MLEVDENGSVQTPNDCRGCLSHVSEMSNRFWNSDILGLKKECSILNTAAMIKIERFSGRQAADDKRTVRNEISPCRANNCSQACQKLRPHVGKALVLVSKSLVLMLSLTVVARVGG